MTILKRHNLIPETVPVEIPTDRNSADATKSSIRNRLNQWVNEYGPFPEHPPCDMKVLSSRKYSWNESRINTGAEWCKVLSSRKHSWKDHAFEEHYISYSGDKGERVPAYLLVPLEGEGPFPAVVANHQCNLDCDLGKEVVVGKNYLRPDQAYGFELALRGYVVLAPDSINCGERNVKGVREQGEGFLPDRCHGKVCETIGVKGFYTKHLWDAVQTVNLLHELDYVDHNRIGMIGHSQGAATTFWTTAYDARIRASVMSCHFLGGLNLTGRGGWGHYYLGSGDGIYYHELLSLIAPRPVLATRGSKELPFTDQGDFETAEDENAVLDWAYRFGKHLCNISDVSEDNMQVRFFQGGHEFPKEEREYAYEWLDRRLNR